MRSPLKALAHDQCSARTPGALITVLVTIIIITIARCWRGISQADHRQSVAVLQRFFSFAVFLRARLQCSALVTVALSVDIFVMGLT